MSEYNFIAETATLVSILDFYRFGLTKAAAYDLYYGHGTDHANDDLFALIFGTLGLSPDSDNVLLHARLTIAEKQKLAQQLKRRIIDKVPVAYLTNLAYFCGFAFYVDQRVIIPRSPIGELIAKQFSPWVDADKVTHILDLCTGSGCLAIACSYAFPQAIIDATDISAAALAVAAINCERHHKQETINLILSDCWAAVPKRQYDLIIANPPYVSKEEMETLPPEYNYEPKLALEAADHGLAIISKVLSAAYRYLSENGVLIVEVGNTEAAVLEAFGQLPFLWLEFVNGGQGVFLLTKQDLPLVI